MILILIYATHPIQIWGVWGVFDGREAPKGGFTLAKAVLTPWEDDAGPSQGTCADLTQYQGISCRICSLFLADFPMGQLQHFDE